MDEEKQRETKEEASKIAEEEEKRKREEAILENIAQIQKDIAQEALNSKLGIQDTEEPTEGKNQENEEVVAGGGPTASLLGDMCP